MIEDRLGPSAFTIPVICNGAGGYLFCTEGATVTAAFPFFLYIRNFRKIKNLFAPKFAKKANKLKETPVKQAGSKIMARPRKPDHLHSLHGTKPHPSTAKTQSDIPAARPKIPSHLSPEARKAWRGLVKLLEERGTLTGADSMALAIWADTQARWVLAKADVHKYGIVIETSVLDSNGVAVVSRKPNPALRTLENCEKSLRAMAREFGCTPQSRERVKPAKSVEEKQPTGAFELMTKAKEKQK